MPPLVVRRKLSYGQTNAAAMGNTRCSQLLVPILMPSVWLLYLLLTALHLPHATSLSFNFDSSQPGGYNTAYFTFQGDAYPDNRVIELTKNDSGKSTGRAWYAAPVAIWDEVTGELASFTTTFSIQIVPDSTDNGKSGEGMAFFLGHYNSSIPSNSVGGGLGLISSGAHHATGDGRIVAVEFDTFLNQGIDASGNHMGIDVNSLISKAYVNTSVPGYNLTSGLVMTCRISYVNSTQRLTADLQIGDWSYHVATNANLRQLLPRLVSIGFSAATGAETVLHRVLSWSFNSTMEKEAPSSPGPLSSRGAAPLSSPGAAALPSPHGENFLSKVQWKVVGPVIGVVLFSVSALAGLVCLSEMKQAAENKQLYPEEAPANVPRPFSYHELAKATNNFAAESKLGEGGYAVVYKGQVANPNQLVAIKNFKLGPSAAHRKKAFEDEIKVISQVRQRHLVELVGWCIDVKEDIWSLVYELLPQGSLHEHLHKGRSWLEWPTRYQIILDLGCALQYLHRMCRDCVLHGDISSSNVLLDSRYIAKLADFGLSRLMDHGMELQATCNLAGTPGYVDPHFVRRGKRSRKSDVYGFGIVLLETVSGRSPATASDQPTEVSPLLKWVWSIYQCTTILEAVDPRLKHESTTEDHIEMERVLLVGLWCAHTDLTQRPPIQDAMRALTSKDVVIPQLPLPGFIAGTSALTDDHLWPNSSSDSILSVDRYGQ